MRGFDGKRLYAETPRAPVRWQGTPALGEQALDEFE
jgi:hypothetical protein